MEIDKIPDLTGRCRVIVLPALFDTERFQDLADCDRGLVICDSCWKQQAGSHTSLLFHFSTLEALI